jgi:hypothetical protein
MNADDDGEAAEATNPRLLAVDLATKTLMESAEDFGLVVSGDRRVNEAGAAKLLGFSHKHLKAIRHAGNGPVVYAVGVDGSRLSYRLSDLASWIEMGREDVMARFSRDKD